VHKSSLSKEAIEDLTPALELLLGSVSFSVIEESPGWWKVWGNQNDGGAFWCKTISERMANLIVFTFESLKEDHNLKDQLAIERETSASLERLIRQLHDLGSQRQRTTREVLEQNKKMAERIEVLTDERDRAREECGYEKRMREGIRQELEWSIQARMKMETEGDNDAATDPTDK
jgi:hypothetical protein